MRYGLEDEVDQYVGQRRHSRQGGGRRMGLVSSKLLGRSFNSDADDSLPGARPASSTTLRPCSGGQAGIICSTMYPPDFDVTDGGLLERGRFRRVIQPCSLALKGDSNVMMGVLETVSQRLAGSCILLRSAGQHPNLSFLSFHAINES